jgi:hypothetical protein
LGKNDENSMSIISIKLPSGWLPIEESLEKLKLDEQLEIKRYETNENRIFLYFDKVKKKNNHIITLTAILS